MTIAFTSQNLDTPIISELQQGTEEGYELYRLQNWLSVEEVLQMIRDFSARPDHYLTSSYRIGFIAGFLQGYQEDYGDATS